MSLWTIKPDSIPKKEDGLTTTTFNNQEQDNYDPTQSSPFKRFLGKIQQLKLLGKKKQFKRIPLDDSDWSTPEEAKSQKKRQYQATCGQTNNNKKEKPKPQPEVKKKKVSHSRSRDEKPKRKRYRKPRRYDNRNMVGENKDEMVKGDIISGDNKANSQQVIKGVTSQRQSQVGGLNKSISKELSFSSKEKSNKTINEKFGSSCQQKVVDVDPSFSSQATQKQKTDSQLNQFLNSSISPMFSQQQADPINKPFKEVTVGRLSSSIGNSPSNRSNYHICESKLPPTVGSIKSCVVQSVKTVQNQCSYSSQYDGPSASKREKYYKTKICHAFQKGRCKKTAPQCNFAHGEEDRRRIERAKDICKDYQPGQCTEAENQFNYLRVKANTKEEHKEEISKDKSIQLKIEEKERQQKEKSSRKQTTEVPKQALNSTNMPQIPSYPRYYAYPYYPMFPPYYQPQAEGNNHSTQVHYNPPYCAYGGMMYPPYGMYGYPPQIGNSHDFFMPPQPHPQMGINPNMEYGLPPFGYGFSPVTRPQSAQISNNNTMNNNTMNVSKQSAPLNLSQSFEPRYHQSTNLADQSKKDKFPWKNK